MNAVCQSSLSPAALPALTRLRPWQGPWQSARTTLATWRANADLRAQLRALEGLSDATLRDIGMAERMPVRQPGLSAIDYERLRF
jgi:uncharacterized protein YjiS (DUF1127 family)